MKTDLKYEKPFVEELKVSRFQGFKVSRFEGFKVVDFANKFQGFKVSTLKIVNPALDHTWAQGTPGRASDRHQQDNDEGPVFGARSAPPSLSCSVTTPCLAFPGPGVA